MPEAGSLGKLPQRLSPSRAKDYIQCPKLFWFKTILGIKTPGSFATYKGTLAHYAFEHIFDFPKGQRGPENSVPYVRAAWEALTNPLVAKDAVEAGSHEATIRDDLGAWAGLHPEGSPQEAKLLSDAAEALKIIDDPERVLSEAEDCVRAWYLMEKPDKFEPYGREYHIEAKVGDVTLHGFIDRLDRIEFDDGEIRYYISDYKTGAPPKPQYEEEAFFQLDVYAALIYAELGVIVHSLRLLYVREGRKDAVITRIVTPERLERTKRKTGAVWKSIENSAKTETWPTRKQVLCGWCYFKSVCPAWHPELDGLLPEEIELKAGNAIL